MLTGVGAVHDDLTYVLCEGGMYVGIDTTKSESIDNVILDFVKAIQIKERIDGKCNQEKFYENKYRSIS